MGWVVLNGERAEVEVGNFFCLCLWEVKKRGVRKGRTLYTC